MDNDNDKIKSHCCVCEIELENEKMCSRCKIVIYCSKYCQLLDWHGGHKDNCKTLNQKGVAQN